MNVALKAAWWSWRFRKTKTSPQYIGHWGVSTPWYLGHRGVLTPRYLGLFWIFNGSGFATPWYIGHRGVLTQSTEESWLTKYWKVLTPRCLGHQGVATLWYLGHRGVSTLWYLHDRTLLDFQRVKFCDSSVHGTRGEKKIETALGHL